ANRMTTESLLMGQVDVLEGLLYNYKAWKKYRYPKLAASIVNLFYKDSYSWGDTVFSSPMYRPITDGYSDVLPGYYISPSRNLNYFAIGDPYPQIDASIINRAGKIIGRVNYCQKSEIAFSKDEKYIIPFWGGWCQVFANNAGKIIAHLELEKLEPSCPDVFDGYCINLEDSTGGYNCIEPSPDGRFQIVISGDSILLTFNNLRDKKLLRFPEEVKDVLFSDDSKYFAVNTDNVCYIFKADAFTLINHFYNHKLKLINFSPKNKIVFFNSSQNTVLYSFAGRMLKNLPVKGEICQVSPCEKYFVLVDNRNERKGEDDKARILYKFNMANLELEYYTSFGSDLSPDLQIYTPLSFFSNDDQFLLYHSGASFFLRDNKSGEINEFTSNYNIDFASFDKDDRVVTLCKYAIYEWNMKVCRISEPESKFKTAELLPDDPFHRFTVFAEDAFEAVIQNSPVYQTHYKKISGLENKYFNKHLPRCENVQFSKDGNYLYTIEEKWNTKLEVKTHEWILNPDIIALIVNDFLNKK
ncbi:MAG TPA: hypothetical protein PK228_13160, partial [Saprospiraceae bacterium]|nr:hypothetical protein [Saprospiraceae bacterium]